MAEAVDAAIAELGFMHRRLARRHLLRDNQPYRTITIDQGDGAISIATNGGDPIRAPATGEPVDWTRPDGTRMQVRIIREDGAVRQSFSAGEEMREMRFRPLADGQGMTAAVAYQIAGLPQPIQYELVYRPRH